MAAAPRLAANVLCARRHSVLTPVSERLIVELFDDVAPSACSAFRARLLPGSSDTFVGGRMLQVTPEESVRGVARGAPASASTAVSAAGTLGFQKQPVLRHTEAGTLSLSLDGAQWALGLAPAPGLDESFQVVGRVVSGEAGGDGGGSREALKTLGRLPRGLRDAPVAKVTLAASGPCSSSGAAAEGGAHAHADETPEQARERLQKAARSARDALKCAGREKCWWKWRHATLRHGAFCVGVFGMRVVGSNFVLFRLSTNVP